MAREIVQDITVVAAGGTFTVDVNSSVTLVNITTSGSVTLTGSVIINASGTPSNDSTMKFILNGNITTDTTTGKYIRIFGVNLSNEQALYEGEVTAFYRDGAWTVRIFPDAQSGNKNIDGANIKNTSIPTGAIADSAITDTKLASMTRGAVKVGNSSNVASNLVGSTAGNILLGNGTDIISTPVTGDVTISSGGVTAIGAGKVQKSMLAYTPVEYLLSEVTLTSENIKNLFTTPVTLIAAPGVGNHIVVVNATAFLKYGTTTYAGGGTLELYYTGDTAVVSTSSSTLVTSAVDKLNSFSLGQYLSTASENKGLDIKNITAAFTTGDSTLVVKVLYYIGTF